MSLSICPYPGLRPFNEEESIFFKGREQQVERLVKRLAEKKFLMVNGASGDGKSSLIYAGVIPYAKAGFFKAKYNNWIVADFRPERSPLKNLTASICRQLKIDDLAQTEKELGYGFSALCDLYKASSYIDESKAEWLKADEKERKVIKRKGANLLVLVDQFEEFFTNPENYQNGIPSIESQKTINLLLETYKLAAAHDLPIYVVCTMRSDYIGQCAAFRGLPEAIGYSQFFVPRLKRQEIEQVIEGPAQLAGCSISKRLTQTLLNSLTDGFDQLPIIQHALNQIWKAANNGNEEMDLIHLAKVGGVSHKILSIEDRQKFDEWFNQLPSYKKDLLKNPSLANILNAHANELMEFVCDNYQSITGNNIEKKEAQSMIECAFKALTRTDNGRAIRRRTTLEEIVGLYNNANTDAAKIDAVLSIFREHGHTFLQPFIDEKGSNKKLKPNSLLDITHESLIRNWDLLKKWAAQENENYITWKELETQLKRWEDSQLSNNYLLASGPLSVYKAWFEKFKPNQYWLLKHDDEKEEIAIKEKKAIKKIDLLGSFLKRSDAALKRKRRLLIGFTSVAFLLMGCLTFLAIRENQYSQDHLMWAVKKEKEADSLKMVAQGKAAQIEKELNSILLGAKINASADKMNILYLGLENPITISVPGFKCSDIEPHLSKGKLIKKDDCKYLIDITNAGIKNNEEVLVTVMAKVNGTLKELDNAKEFVFRAKDIPEPKISFNENTTNDFYMTVDEFIKAAPPKPVLVNFDFDVKLRLEYFFFIWQEKIGQNSRQLYLSGDFAFEFKEDFEDRKTEIINNAIWQKSELITENPINGKIIRKPIEKTLVQIDGAKTVFEDKHTSFCPGLKFYVYRELSK